MRIRQNENKINIILIMLGIVPITWLALIIAPYIGKGILEIIAGVSNDINTPLNIKICENSIKTILLFLLIYALGIGIFYSSKKNYRRKEEYGSASWGIAKQINKKYKQSPITENKILTQNVRLGLNAKKHRRNLNVLICGRKWCR